MCAACNMKDAMVLIFVVVVDPTIISDVNADMYYKDAPTDPKGEI